MQECLAADNRRSPGEQAGPVAGVLRRSWCSPIARCDWEPEPFVPREVAPHEHPIATLGTDPEAMRAAQAYCAAVLARVGESESESAS